MQTTKEYTHKLLLETARRAFFKKGFKAVSMREISKLSGIGLSNIYNYYPCKDDLLADVLHPLLEAMNSMLEDHNRPEAFSLDVFTSEEYHRSSMKEVMNIVRRYREEFKLLFSSIQDSRFNDYWEQWIKRSTVMGIEYMEGMKKLYPDLHTDISLFFMHFTCSWWVNMMKEVVQHAVLMSHQVLKRWVNMMKEVVQHEELSSEEIECFIGEYIRFSTGGWKRLMNVKIER